MKAMVVKDNIIENIIVVDSLDVFPNLVEFIDSANIGDSITDGILVKNKVELSNEYMLEYLKETEWVESYYIKHLTGVEEIPSSSSKWDIISVRNTYKSVLRDV